MYIPTLSYFWTLLLGWQHDQQKTVSMRITQVHVLLSTAIHSRCVPRISLVGPVWLWQSHVSLHPWWTTIPQCQSRSLVNVLSCGAFSQPLVSLRQHASGRGGRSLACIWPCRLRRPRRATPMTLKLGKAFSNTGRWTFKASSALANAPLKSAVAICAAARFLNRSATSCDLQT